MHQLPAELRLAILSYLPLSSLRALQSVSREWRHFFSLNEAPIYRSAAALHKWISPLDNISTDLNSRFSRRSLFEVDGWKSLCQRRAQIARSWRAAGPSTVTEHAEAGYAVHRFKVDEMAGYIICTSKEGGLIVSNLDSPHSTLWSLSVGYVRPYAHCEYSEGFLVFDRSINGKEVWRREVDCGSADIVSDESLPDRLQMRAGAVASDLYDGRDCRGKFKPWALLHMPEATRAFRLVYPTLLVVSWNRAYLYDVRTGKLSQTIESTQMAANQSLGTINYVELSERHVFICGSHTLLVFSRSDGRCVLNISSTQVSYGNWQFALSFSDTSQLPYRMLLPHIVKRNYDDSKSDNRVLIDQFMAVHVSSCGSNIVALLRSARVLIIYDFERALRGEATIQEITLDVQLGSRFISSKYLAFEHGRIAVATGAGVFILQPLHCPSEMSPTSNSPSEYPEVLISRTLCFGDRAYLRGVSCLQMTDTGLFINWDRDASSHPHDFIQTLSDGGSYTQLPNGDHLVLTDYDFPDALEGMRFSSVFSVDFVPVTRV